jgi:hypothetical protein
MADRRLASLSKKSLPTCVAALLAFDAAQATDLPNAIEDRAPQVVVMNCDDSGSGSLREALFNVAAHAIVDLSQLQCSDITLISGEIAVTADDVTVKGPGTSPQAMHRVTIHGGASYGYRNRIFEAGTGKFTVTGLALTDAYALPVGVNANGGCISSGGELVIDDSIITGCEIDAPYGSSAIPFGGGVFASDKLSIMNSDIEQHRLLRIAQ